MAGLKASSFFTRLHANDHGAAAVSFILALPIFLTIVAVIVQMALLVNARLMVENAADAAARSAVTALPEEREDDIRRAAYMALAQLSPKGEPVTPEALAEYEALKQLGVDVSETFPNRYAYAMEATDVSWNPQIRFQRAEAQEVDVTVTYRLKLTVPGAMRFVRATKGTLGGVEGRFWTVTATTKVQTAHGREARADEDGWPR